MILHCVKDPIFYHKMQIAEQPTARCRKRLESGRQTESISRNDIYNIFYTIDVLQLFSEYHKTSGTILQNLYLTASVIYELATQFH